MIESLNSLTSLLEADRKCDGWMGGRGQATVTGTIWSLHRVIANPESSTEDVTVAKRLLLRLLEKTKAFPQLDSLKAKMKGGVRTSRSETFSRSEAQRSSDWKQWRSSSSPCKDRS